MKKVNVITKRSFKYVTPLLAVARKKQKDVVHYLLEKGARISASTKSNYKNAIGHNGIILPHHSILNLEEPKFSPKFESSADNQIDIVRSFVVPGRSNPSEFSYNQVPIPMNGWRIFKSSRIYFNWILIRMVEMLLVRLFFTI